MGRYQAYPEYKNSGVEWVGEIPANWLTKPLFAVASTSCVRNEDGAENNVLSLSYGRIVKRDVEDNFGLLPESFNTYQLVSKGDLILRLTDLQNDKRSLRVGHSNEVGIITSAYLKLTAKENIFHDKYLYRLLHSYDTTKVFYGMGGGLRQSMKFDDMKRLEMLVPSFEEQQKIANFLDHETAKIDTLIEKQQQLIQLLKEKRQAVISHAVTKGLNPNVPMKDSGVEWLGDVPEHWEVYNLDYALSAIGDVDHYMPKSVDIGIPYVMTGDLKEFASNINYEGCKQISSSDYLALSKKIKCTKGDVIMARYATIGTVSYVDVDSNFVVSYSCVTIKPNPLKVIGLYLYYYFKSDAFLQGIQSQINTNTQGNVGISDLKKIKIALPTLAEQAEIIEYLQSKINKFDYLSDKSETSIALVQERRTALISAAVTGKIDVRNF